MKRYAVARIDWFDNDLTIEIVSANDWREALTKHSKSFFNDEYPVPSNINAAKQACFDCDGMMEVVELMP